MHGIPNGLEGGIVIIRAFSWGVAVCILAWLPARATVMLSATGNATVQPLGPRTGANGLRFLNIEGSANSQFASYGVIDFAPATPVTTPAPAPTVQLTLQLTQSNAAFTANGGLSFYLVEDTATPITAGASPLRFDPTAAPGGFSGQLAPAFLLGTGLFTQVANRTVDRFAFSLTGAEQSYLTTELATSSPVRLVVAASDPGTAATYAGSSNTNTSGPVLVLDTAAPPMSVPEPNTLLLTCAGLAGLANHRRRQYCLVARNK